MMGRASTHAGTFFTWKNRMFLLFKVTGMQGMLTRALYQKKMKPDFQQALHLLSSQQLQPKHLSQLQTSGIVQNH